MKYKIEIEREDEIDNCEGEAKTLLIIPYDEDFNMRIIHYSLDEGAQIFTRLFLNIAEIILHHTGMDGDELKNLLGEYFTGSKKNEIQTGN